MQLSYDPRRNVAYIRLKESSGEVETVRVSDSLNVDLAPDGHVGAVRSLRSSGAVPAATARRADAGCDLSRVRGRPLVVHLRVGEATLEAFARAFAANNAERRPALLEPDAPPCGRTDEADQKHR